VALEVSEDLGQVQGIDGERRIEEAKGKIEGCQGTPVAVIHGQDQVLDSGTDFHGDSQDGVFRRLRQGATEGGFVPGYPQISQIPEIAVGLSWLGWGLTIEGTGDTEGEEGPVNNDGSEGGRRFWWGECPHEPGGSPKFQDSAGRALRT